MEYGYAVVSHALSEPAIRFVLGKGVYITYRLDLDELPAGTHKVPQVGLVFSVKFEFDAGEFTASILDDRGRLICSFRRDEEIGWR